MPPPPYNITAIAIQIRNRISSYDTTPISGLKKRCLPDYYKSLKIGLIRFDHYLSRRIFWNVKAEISSGKIAFNCSNLMFCIASCVKWPSSYHSIKQEFSHLICLSIKQLFSGANYLIP